MWIITTKKVKGFCKGAQWIVDTQDLCEKPTEAIRMFLGEFTQYKEKHITKVIKQK